VPVWTSGCGALAIGLTMPILIEKNGQKLLDCAAFEWNFV
jgi:hypothetical protein